MVKIDISGAKNFFDSSGPDYAAAAAAQRALSEGKGPGAEFSGWLDIPSRIIRTELKSILNASEKIKSQSSALVVIGIGGSYLGARAGIELIRPSQRGDRSSEYPDVYFAGTNLSPDALSQIISLVEDRDFSVNVISKSGTTLEPSIAFRVFKALLEKKYGSNAKRRIYVTTDSEGGVLRSIANTEGYESFIVPGDIGGRYSVLSAVGLLPMAAAGVGISTILATAQEELSALSRNSPDNPAWQYAAVRQHLYKRGKIIEVLASYEPAFHYMAEWWKQLFGESEGKNGVGIFPASVEYTADLHSMGQYIQDGPRHLLETVVSFNDVRGKVKVPFALGDPDGLNYLAGKDLGDICKTVAEAVRTAHISGGVPNIGIEASGMDEEGFAELICFFEVACAISGYMLGVNPFDQPGVEAYKSGMFRLLGKPSSE